MCLVNGLPMLDLLLQPRHLLQIAFNRLPHQIVNNGQPLIITFISCFYHINGLVLVDVVGVGEDADLHDLVELRADVLVRCEVLIEGVQVAVVVLLEVLARVQVVVRLIGSVVG